MGADDQPVVDPSPAEVRATLERDGLRASGALAGAGQEAPPERRTWVPTPGCQIIACIDVEPMSDVQEQPGSRDVLWHLAVRRMERCVRPGDWICMLGGSRLAVCFGNGAHRIPASALGRRLARAMGDHLAVGATSTELDVAVGIGVATDDLEPAAVTGAAMASIRSARHHRNPSTGAPRPFVAVSRVPGSPSITSDRRPGTPLWSSDHPRFVRRILVPLGDEAAGSGSTAPAASKRGRPAGSGRQRSHEAAMRLLIVDPEPMPHATRLGAAAVASLARRAGALPTVSTATTVKRVMLDHYVAEPHAVVLVLHPEPAPPLRAGTPDPWEEAASLTRTLRQAGTPVVVVGFGASAMAVAACVEEGATGLFALEGLGDELARIAQKLQGARGGRGSGSHNGLEALPFPAPYRGLVDLTPAERRVLHQMMRGLSATDIAAEQVVALSTVRTHIRSILRKLNVNSQLAAVAIAHGSIPLDASSA